MIADRRAARRHDDVGIDAGEGGGELVEPVGHNPQIDAIDRQAGEQRCEHHTVGFGQLPGLGQRPRRHQFIAGGQNSDPHPPAHRKRAMAGGGRQREPRGGEPLARAQQDIACAEIQPHWPNIGAAPWWAVTGHTQHRAVASRFFLHQHGVGAGGQDRPGEDPHRLIRLNGASERPPRRTFAHHRDRSGQVGIAQRKAVHRRERCFGLRATRSNVLRQPAAQRADERHLLNRHRGAQREQPRPRLRHRQQGHAGRLHSPDLPPVLLRRRMSPIVMALSIALAMS